jgi:hypothetical protein
MHFLIRASCLVVASVIAVPAVAQQIPGPTATTGSTKISKPLTLAEGGVQAGYLKTCGARFVCYTGIPLQCTPHTRPYQNISDHQCFCLRDNCP